jgi:hypothetical protein
MILPELILAVGPLQREHHALVQLRGVDAHWVRYEQRPEGVSELLISC